jgi:hypothetical protein
MTDFIKRFCCHFNQLVFRESTTTRKWESGVASNINIYNKLNIYLNSITEILIIC